MKWSLNLQIYKKDSSPPQAERGPGFEWDFVARPFQGCIARLKASRYIKKRPIRKRDTRINRKAKALPYKTNVERRSRRYALRIAHTLKASLRVPPNETNVGHRTRRYNSGQNDVLYLRKNTSRQETGRYGFSGKKTLAFLVSCL